MEVVVTGRHCEVSDRFREHVSEKLSRLEKHDHRIMRVQVEVELEKNPRQHDRSTKVELTAFSKGPVIRAEAAAEDKMGALDLALDKMQAQMRRAADRRRVHKGRNAHVGVGEALASLPEVDDASADDEGVVERKVGPITVTGDGPLVVREKSHTRDRDDPRPGPLRDGARRARLLPLRGQGERAAVGGLPPPRLRLRSHLARGGLNRSTAPGHARMT